MEDREVSVHCVPVGRHTSDDVLNVILQIVCAKERRKTVQTGGERPGKMKFGNGIISLEKLERTYLCVCVCVCVCVCE